MDLTVDDPAMSLPPDLEMDQPAMVSDPTADLVWFNFAGIYDLKPGDVVTLADGTTTRSLVDSAAEGALARG